MYFTFSSKMHFTGMHKINYKGKLNNLSNIARLTKGGQLIRLFQTHNTESYFL